MSNSDIINVESLSAGYGQALTLQDVSFSLPENGSLALLGRNGVGKSTLALTLMGYTRLHHGRIVFRGHDVTRLASYRRVGLGMGWVPQEREVFPSLTIDEHLAIAASKGPWTPERVYDLFPRLKERRASLGKQLSGGEQQMLAIARALVTNPRLLLLDEPLEGLAPVVVKELSSSLRRLLADQQMAIIIIEQHTKFALELTDQVLVLDRGRVAHVGPSKQLGEDKSLLDRLVGMRRLAADVAG